jgi:hypothetical protein
VGTRTVSAPPALQDGTATTVIGHVPRGVTEPVAGRRAPADIVVLGNMGRIFMNIRVQMGVSGRVIWCEVRVVLVKLIAMGRCVT